MINNFQLFLQKLKRAPKKDKLWITYFWLLSVSLLLFFIPDSFKIAVVLSLFFCLGLFLIYRNLLFALTAIFFSSAPFILPAKVYEFELISRDQYLAWEHFPEGIGSFYGVSVSTLFLLFIVIHLAIKGLEFLITTPKLDSKVFVGLNLNHLPIYTFILFLIALVYSSSYYSFFPVYSLSVALEYIKVVIFLIAMYLCTAKQKIFKDAFLVVIFVVLSLHLLTGMYNLVFDREGVYDNRSRIAHTYNPPEEKTIIPRFQGGIVNNSNGFGYHLLALYLVVRESILIKENTYLKRGLSLLLVSSILLLQTRTAWLQSILVILTMLNISQYRKQAAEVVSSLKKRKLLLPGSAIIAILFGLFIWPRLTASTYFFSQTGGGHLRLTMLSEAYQVLQFSPWFGFGAGSSLKAMFSYMPNGYVQNFPFEIHLALMQITLESGLLGGAMFITTYILLFKRSVSTWIATAKQSVKTQTATLTSLILILFVQYSFQVINIRNEWYILALPLYYYFFHLRQTDTVNTTT